MVKWVAVRRDEKWWRYDFAIFLFTSPRDSISLGNAFTSERRRRNRAGTSGAVDYQDRVMPFHARCRISIKKSPLRIIARAFAVILKRDISDTAIKFLNFDGKFLLDLALRRKRKSGEIFYNITFPVLLWYRIFYYLIRYLLDLRKREIYANLSQ